jgi:hypothetical protein
MDIGVLGTQLTDLAEIPGDKFWPFVNKTDGCWLWTGLTFRHGYGCIHPFPKSNRTVQAHRVSYALHFGEFDKSLYVCHKCDTPGCVNPAHLFLGTARDNVIDQIAKGRKPSAEDAFNSKLTMEDARTIRGLYACSNLSWRSIAKMYSVSTAVVQSIITNEHYKDESYVVVTKDTNKIKARQKVHRLAANASAKPKHTRLYASGESQGLSKLTWEKVDEIRLLYSQDETITLSSLAKAYGVSPTTIRDVLIFKTWRR